MTLKKFLKTIKNKTIKLDGKTLRDTKYVGCKMIYSGGNLSMDNCTLENPQIVLNKAAANTLLVLRGLYQGGAKRAVLKALDTKGDF